MNWRLGWTVDGNPFYLTMLASGSPERLAMRQLHAGLVASGHEATLERQTDGWVEVDA